MTTPVTLAENRGRKTARSPRERCLWRPGSQVMSHCKLGRPAMGSERQHDFAEWAAKRHAPRAWPRDLTTCMAMSNYQRWSRPPDHPGQLTTEEHERGNHP